jgi:hypothetical protein
MQQRGRPMTAAAMWGMMPSVQPKAATTLARAPAGQTGGQRVEDTGAGRHHDDQDVMRKSGLIG